MKPALNKIQTRSFQIDAVRDNANAQSFDVSCSSDAPIRMGGIYEILDHSESAVDLSRFLAAAPLQLEHFGEQIGVVEKAWLEDGKLRATIRFSRSAKAQEILQDVIDGIRQNVSIRYGVSKYQDAPAVDGIPCYRAIRWTPSHVAIVGEPADINVGFNRSLGNLTADEMAQLQSLLAKANAAETEDEPERSTNAEAESETEQAATTETQDDEKESSKDDETQETEKDARSADDETESSEILIEDEATSDEDTADAQDQDNNNRAVSTAPITVRDRQMKANSDTVLNPNIVLNEREQKEYSLVRAIRNVIDGKRDGLEFEVSEQIAKTRGVSTQGFYMPTSLRSFAISDTATAGAMTFAQGGEFIDFLRNRATVVKLGAQAINLPGKITLPRATTELSAAQWIAEDGSGATLTSGSMDQVTFSPKKLATYTAVTREALTVANYDVQSIITNNIYNNFAVAFDRAAIQGTGGTQPLGLLNQTGLVSGTVNGAFTYAAATELWGVMAGNNANTDSMKLLTTPTIKAGAMSRIRSGSTADFVVGDNGKVGLWDIEHSMNVSSGYVIAGDWNSLVLAEFGAIEVIVDPYTGKHAGRVELAATMLGDVQLQTLKSFAVQKSIT